jgi:hypothetical protein
MLGPTIGAGERHVVRTNQDKSQLRVPMYSTVRGGAETWKLWAYLCSDA